MYKCVLYAVHTCVCRININLYCEKTYVISTDYMCTKQSMTLLCIIIEHLFYVFLGHSSIRILKWPVKHLSYYDITVE